MVAPDDESEPRCSLRDDSDESILQRVDDCVPWNGTKNESALTTRETFEPIAHPAVRIDCNFV